ncbi:hypothetical protein STEG23_022038 [Scotinomys teguina]
MKFAGKWKELENIILSEVTQTQKDKHEESASSAYEQRDLDGVLEVDWEHLLHRYKQRYLEVPHLGNLQGMDCRLGLEFQANESKSSPKYQVAFVVVIVNGIGQYNAAS